MYISKLISRACCTSVIISCKSVCNILTGLAIDPLSLSQTEISYPNGLILTHFADDQMEKAHPDGTKEIIFPNGTRRRFDPSGVEIF